MSEFTQEFFEESSRLWKANKVRIGEGMYRYKKNAFPKCNEQEQMVKQTKRIEKELDRRHTIDEYAPPRVKRSSRLRQKEIQELYT